MSSKSGRSVRVRTDARQRPDAVWTDAQGSHEVRFDVVTPQNALSGGSELSQLVAEADAHLAAMRQLVL